eukprot:Phypoly_transcript_02102.p1 GENE.Phypoly_transcript_02102~~Phypoly_transcript_02102.p1  ORF type:complete len:596 (+),score=121.69 Phypoly_transcript_02102:57-1790(+)
MRFFVGLVLLALACTCAFADITNTKVLRSIDLTTQLARHTINITAENKGASTSTYSLAVQNATNLAFIKAESDAGASLVVTPGEADKTNGYTTYKINLAIDAGKTVNFKVYLVYFASLKPFPTEITMNGRQLVRYYSNAYFYSPYPTGHQRTTVKLASTHLEGHSEAPTPIKVSGDTITYGAYSDIKPLTHASLWVHFENHSPFLTITKMVKEYEVSHWGNLAVEQHLDVRHDGAALKGHFSRLDFQRNPGGSPAAVLQITEILPNEASDVYYRDDIGNISTSSFTPSEKGLEFHIVPRFPLFGGWKNNWYTGYNLPLHPFLFTDSSSTYRLKVPFASSLGQVITEDYTLRVILPEGSTVTKVDVPFEVQKSDAKHFTYLDTTGRPVIVLSKRNVVPEHNVVITIEYQFSWLTKWHEPLLLAAGFFVLLALVMVYVRFSLSIKPVDTAKAFHKRDEIINNIKNVNVRLDSELARQAAAAEKSTESTFRWNARPSVLDDLMKVASSASPVTTGEAFAARVKEYVDAQINRFKYQGKVYASRFATGAKKVKAEKQKKIQEKLQVANDAVQQFVEDWIQN